MGDRESLDQRMRAPWPISRLEGTEGDTTGGFTSGWSLIWIWAASKSARGLARHRAESWLAPSDDMGLGFLLESVGSWVG